MGPLELGTSRPSNKSRQNNGDEEEEQSLGKAGPLFVPLGGYPVPHRAHSTGACALALGRGFALGGGLGGSLRLTNGRHLGGSRRRCDLFDFLPVGGDLDDQVIGLIEDLAAWRNRQVPHPDLVV